MARISLLLICLAIGAAAQGPPLTPPVTGQHSRPPVAAGSPARAVADPISQLQATLNKMQSLRTQMEMNLPFAAPTENPLKHQFELEIEMWGVLTQQLQKQLDQMRASSGRETAPDTGRPQPGKTAR